MRRAFQPLGALIREAYGMNRRTASQMGVLAGLAAILSGTGCGGGPAPASTAAGGGANAAGGAEATGGVAGSGGTSKAGGAPGSGGSLTLGGTTGAGGATGTGGATGAGGAPASGGAPGAGGARASGGSAGSSSPGRDASPGSGGIGAVSDAGATSSEAGNPASCPAPPAGAPADAVTAINTENALRVAMGVPCANLVLALCTSAQNHCNYYATNNASATCRAASPHSEIAGCPEYTGADIGTRMRAAGYGGRGGFECMSFLGNPASSVKSLIDTVYHRIPILSPWLRDVGYGGTRGCDTLDFGTGPAADKTITAVYPYDGQINVPLSFNGAFEGPNPPTPSTGWPSGYPITLFGQGITVTSHQIVVDGGTAALPHVWLDGDATLGNTAKVLYTEKPLTANTTYRVTIEGTTAAGSVRFDWRFTTGAARRG